MSSAPPPVMKRETSFAIDPAWNVVFPGLGVSKSDVLRRAQLPEDLFDRREARLTTPRFFEFWQALEECVAVEAFALALTEQINGEIFAPCLFAALCSPNLRVALERLDTYKRLTMPMRLHFDTLEDGLRVQLVWTHAEGTAPGSLVATELAYFVQMARVATRHRVEAVDLECELALEPHDRYAQWFGTAPRRGARNSLSFATEDLERPFLTHNAGVWNLFEGELRRRLADLDRTNTMGERATAALLVALPSGRGTLEDVAAQLDMSPRTLQRRLHAEGTAFKDILRQTRMQLAAHYLTNTDITASEIGFLLGFDESTSFFRAYQGWTGQTPEATRRAAQASHS